MAHRLAPAKVNLFLHVGPEGADGYHPLVSLVTFANVGDVVTMRRARDDRFEVEGPFAAELAGEADNLVLKARDLPFEADPQERPPLAIRLNKRLPVAAGLGGGSADAAATLRLLADLGLAVARSDAPYLEQLARRLGADLPMCLAGLPAVAEGKGERLGPPPVFPDIDAVLVNPLKPSPTGSVYRAYDEAGAPGGTDAPDWPEAMETTDELVAFLAGCRNDLEAPAISLQPAIGEVLAALKGRPHTRLARMSGSGATCFAICASDRAARDLALAIGDERRDWWVRSCRLAGFRP